MTNCCLQETRHEDFPRCEHHHSCVAPSKKLDMHFQKLDELLMTALDEIRKARALRIQSERLLAKVERSPRQQKQTLCLPSSPKQQPEEGSLPHKGRDKDKTS
jgi:hypothetical protein